MQAIVRVGYLYTIDAHHLHPVVWGAVCTLVRNRVQSPWEGLQVGPSFCPPRRARLCTCFRGFVALVMCLVLVDFTWLMRAVFGLFFASGWVFMVYLSTRDGGVGCAVFSTDM
jgi:hypothetical protein